MQLWLLIVIFIINTNAIPCRLNTPDSTLLVRFPSNTIFNDVDVEHITYTVFDVTSHSVVFKIPKSDYKIYNYSFDISVTNELSNIFKLYESDYAYVSSLKTDKYSDVVRVNPIFQASPCYMYIELASISNITVNFNFTYGYTNESKTSDDIRIKYNEIFILMLLIAYCLF
jgi:hypothetical protein